MQIIDIILFLAAIAVVGVMYFFVFKKDKMPGKRKDISGSAASAKVVAATRRYAVLQQYELIAPANITKNEKTAALDCILVGSFGLLCVKCIGLGGEIYGGADDAKWLQVLEGNRIAFDNPLQACAADTRLVRDTLFAAKLKNIPVETICVFTNKKTELAVPRSAGHYTLKTFKALLGKDKLLQNKNVDIAAASAAVKAYLAAEA